MTKLVIQIPCLNEADQLAETMATIPRSIEGVDAVEILVIDDGSTDGTVDVAKRSGADHIHSNPTNMGLAKSYIIGLEQALLRGADIIVNFDADNQYPAHHIPDLVAPVLAGEAQIVVGARPIAHIEHFSMAKRMLQKLGSWVVRKASGLKVPDAPSGFRAVSQEAAFRLYTFSAYSYTIETLIQAGRMNIPVASIPITVNPPTRPSRLMTSMGNYIRRSMMTIARIGLLYYPLRVFFWLAIFTALPGVIAILRFVIYYLSGDGTGKLQSLILGSGLFAAGVILMIGGVLADLISANRVLLQDIRARVLEDKVWRIRSGEGG